MVFLVIMVYFSVYYINDCFGYKCRVSNRLIILSISRVNIG